MSARTRKPRRNYDDDDFEDEISDEISDDISDGDDDDYDAPATATARGRAGKGKRSARPRKKVARYSAEEYGSTLEEDKLLEQALKNSLKDVRRVEYDIPEAPVKHPTHEEFKDPVRYIASIKDECARFGMCLVVPPEGWNPPFCIDTTSPKKFSTRQQVVHTLQEARVDGFADGQCYSYQQYKSAAEAFRAKWLRENYTADFSPPFEDLEKDYWRMVETGQPSATVEYGNDIDSSQFGSGFPRGYARKGDVLDSIGLKETSDRLGVIDRGDMTSDEYYKCSGWNLQNIAVTPGSLLQYQTEPITGINSPWLYFGMMFTSFCWHTEDNYLYSINYSHMGCKQWYCVPGQHAVDFDKAVKQSHFVAYKDDPDFLYDITTQFSPSFLISRGVPVFRVVQQPQSFIVTFPRAYHGGFNYEFNCNEACNFAIADWLPLGSLSIEKYRTSARASPFSLVRLMFTLARNFKNIPNPKDKLMLVQEVMAVVLKEIEERNFLRREGVANVLDDKSKLPKTNFCLMTKEGMDYDDKRTCFLCKYVCVMSAVACQCDKTKVACSLHYRHMCKCPNSSRWLIAWFSDQDVQDLLRRLRADVERCSREIARSEAAIISGSSSSSSARSSSEYALVGAVIL